MTDYTHVDAMIIRMAEQGARRKDMLDPRGGVFKSAQIAAMGHPRFAFSRTFLVERIIDRRVQALRNRGDISFDGKRWRLA